MKREKMSIGEILVALAVLAVLALSVVPLLHTQKEKLGEQLDRANENAAKALAVIAYYGSGEDAGTSFVKYYDADNNELLAERPLNAAYGVGSPAGKENADNEGKFLRLEAREGEGIVSTDWVEYTDEELEALPEQRGYREN